MTSDDARKDLQAAVAARQELGPEYEAAIIESFLDRLEAHHRASAPQSAQPPAEQRRERDPGGLALAIVSVVASIPITAVSANQVGLIGVVVGWASLVAINLARTLGRRN